ncbi:neutral zinc metallopeptidase [Aerococcaceae bacterium zg-ZJ1578]|uniref:KPN_02809 family neutral zinc metallopeptidase n=1 Tax=Aerococcaceae bacterium zg-252 TaxID=2796928 RepID=UPI001A300690|nr:neutral zinc metallopeptidase [Aerococcaceae bacterium zg-1578]
MKWEDVRQSKNVQDRRNQTNNSRYANPTRRVVRGSNGGMGGNLLWLLLARTSGKTKLLLLALFLLMSFFGSGNLFSSLNNSTIYNQQITPSQEVSVNRSTSSQSARPTDEDVAFFSAVLATTEDFWHQKFAEKGLKYREPQLVIYSDYISTACGQGSAQAGPFYCPGDETVYVDLQFYRELTRKYNAPGDFAMAYVIAHEVGHHVQVLTGTMDAFTRAKQRATTKEGNALTVRLELQADYYAGAWAKYVEQQNLLEVGDIEEALQAAHAVGDDTLQKENYGYVVPDSFTHGSSKQRQTWFYRGYQYSDFEHGDTFNSDI